MSAKQSTSTLIGVATSTTVLLAGAVFGALLWLGDVSGLFGIWLLVVVVPGFIAYLHSVAAATASGQREPPPAAIAQFNIANIGALLAHGLLMILALVWLARFAWPLKSVFYLLLALVPASFLLLATTRDLMAAFSPLQLVRLIQGLGFDYLGLLGLTIVAALVSVAASQALPSLLAYVIGAWETLALAAIGGSLLYQRHRVLDLPIATIDEKSDRADRLEDNRKWQRVMDEAYLLLRNGEVEQAYTLLHGRIERDGDTIESYEIIYERMREWGMEYHTSQVARRLVERLIADNQPQRALEVTEERLRHDDEFRPPPSTCHTLAQHAREFGHDATADLLEPPPH